MSLATKNWPYVPLFFYMGLLAGCPGDDTGGDDEVGEIGDGDGESDVDGDGDLEGEPTCPPSDHIEHELPQEPLQPWIFKPSEGNFLDLEALCQPAENDYQITVGLDWEDIEAQLLVYHPEDTDGEWPDGQFPIVFHHHGNGQNGDAYEHLARAVVDDGAIFVSVKRDNLTASPSTRALIDICMLRWLFSQADWDGNGPQTIGAAKLDGNVIVVGHSNGGEGAHIVANWFEERPWQDDPEAPEHQMRLCGVVGIAPRGADPSNAPFAQGIEIAGDRTVPYLTIEGSVDNDVPGGSLWNSSHSGFDEFHGPTDAAKITVWVYDAEHDSFGGGGDIREGDVRGLPAHQQHARGAAIASVWLDAFVRRFIFADLAAELALYGRAMPEILENPAWWDYHPAYEGAPLVFVGSEPHQSPAEGERGIRVVIDTMCRWSGEGCMPTVIGNGPSPTSEHAGGLRAENWAFGALRSDRAWELAAYDESRGAYQTAALRAGLGAVGDPGPRVLAWNLEPFDLRDAVAFSFRASNIDAVNYPGEGQGCSPVDGDPTDEIDFEVVFVSLGGEEVSVAVSDYARLVAPDIFEVVHALTLTPDMCPVSHFLQTVRIPLDEVVCDAFPPGRLREVRFVFDASDGPDGRAVLLDTVEFHRDGSGQPVCRS